MNIRYSTGLMVTLAAALCVSACDSDDSSATPTTINSGIPAATPLSTLTDAQVTQLNQAVADYATAQAASLSKAQICGFTGYMAAATTYMMATTTPDATLQSTCSTLVDSCNQSSTTPTTNGSTGTGAGTTTTALAGCTATVAQYQDCLKASTDASITMVKSSPACASITAASLGTAGGVDTTEPASCTALYDACPNAW